MQLSISITLLLLDMFCLILDHFLKRSPLMLEVALALKSAKRAPYSLSTALWAEKPKEKKLQKGVEFLP